LLMDRAEALGEPAEDPLLLFSVLYGFWAASYVALNGDAVRELAARFMRLAEKQGTTAPVMIGHRLMGISLLITGDIAEGRVHYDQAIALYDPAEHAPLATRFGQDVGVAILSYRSLALWLLGYPDAAHADAGRAIERAREIGQAATLMYALAYTGVTHTLCGNYAAAAAQGRELVTLAETKGALLWEAAGTMMQGYVSALTGNASKVVKIMPSAIAAWRSTGSTVWIPFASLYLARAYAELCQFDDAWSCIHAAMTTMETTKERWCEAEVRRVAGEIALMLAEPGAAKAEAYFERALLIARAQQAKSWELRAAMSLTRLKRHQGKQDEARDLLAPVYGWFTDGFDTLDLKEAKVLLAALA
jgi:predicted ATPase